MSVDRNVAFNEDYKRDFSSVQHNQYNRRQPLVVFIIKRGDKGGNQVTEYESDKIHTVHEMDG